MQWVAGERVLNREAKRERQRQFNGRQCALWCGEVVAIVIRDDTRHERSIIVTHIVKRAHTLTPWRRLNFVSYAIIVRQISDGAFAVFNTHHTQHKTQRVSCGRLPVNESVHTMRCARTVE